MDMLKCGGVDHEALTLHTRDYRQLTNADSGRVFPREKHTN